MFDFLENVAPLPVHQAGVILNSGARVQQQKISGQSPGRKPSVFPFVHTERTGEKFILAEKEIDAMKFVRSVIRTGTVKPALEHVPNRTEEYLAKNVETVWVKGWRHTLEVVDVDDSILDDTSDKDDVRPMTALRLDFL